MAYRLVWLEIAGDQYQSLPADLHTIVDRRLSRLRADPTGEPDAVYNRRSDQYSVRSGHGVVTRSGVRDGYSTLRRGPRFPIVDGRNRIRPGTVQAA